jgi:hypothetical protein
MRKHYLLISFLLICALMAGGVYAHTGQDKGQGGSGDGSPGEVSDPKGDQDQDRNRTQDQDQFHDPDQTHDQTTDRDRAGQDEEATYFTAQDGNTYRWQHRFNRKLSRYDEHGDAQAMYKYLERIANRYNFEYGNDADDFVSWALQNRPWDTE